MERKIIRKPCAYTLAVILIISISALLSACSKNKDLSEQRTQLPQTDIHDEGTEEDMLEDGNIVTSETSNILIVYFAVAENSEVDAISSASVRVVDGEAKGNIRVFADEIQANVGGDMFSIQTSTKYPANIMAVIDYASEEQKEDSRPELTTQIENFDDYNVIFIGYPNWWYDMPMVMYSFFDEYDFSDKTIIPFCTHNGSGFSSTINTIKELEPKASVMDGFTINGNNVEKVTDDVAEWISELEI